MSFIKSFQNISKHDVSIAGGKGASLGEMLNAGIPVPPGFVILASAFDRFLEETDLNVEIKARLKEVKIDDTNSIEKASVVIRDAIHDHTMPEDLQKEILGAYDALTTSPCPSPSEGEGALVAVRSSATAEDSSVASWAGELETYLNTTREQVIDRVKDCWSSLFTPRAIFYRHEKNLVDHDVSVAVVIQKMVQSHISGIAFTVHPVTEDPDQMIIEAGYGLGEAIVSGQITPDSYVVSKSTMEILDINVGNQSKMLKKDGGAGRDLPVQNVWVDLNDEIGNKQKLTGRKIIEVAQMCKKIEVHYGFPCDIEWAMDGTGELFITQSRPITTLKKK